MGVKYYIRSKFEKFTIKKMIKRVNAIYSNKSSDEYKCKGDFKKSPNYEDIKTKLFEDFPKISGLPKADLTVLQNAFKCLEKPIWKAKVGQFMIKPDDDNFIYAAYFAICYRTLYGEIARIIACIEATENGLTYVPDKIVEHNKNNMKILKKMSENADALIKEALKEAKAMDDGKDDETLTQEAATLHSLGVEAVSGVLTVMEKTIGVLGNMFKSALALNPISFMSAILSRSYDGKIEKYEYFNDLYNETVAAYNEYKKLPASKRKERVEHKYAKMIDKYNIRRENLKKQIDHYDRRSMEENEENDEDTTPKKESSSSKKDSDDKSKTTKSESEKKKDNVDTDEKKLPNSSSTVDSSNKSDGDFDF